MKPTIFAALPTYDGRRRNADAVWQLLGIKDAEVRYLEIKSSLLAWGFNMLWATALNERPDFFLMLHDDIVPVYPDWPVTLFNEFRHSGASVLSVVSPIKTPEGLTSTALETGNPFWPRRLTMTEVYDREETWTEPGLLINTGLMLVDFREAWVEGVCFTINDRIVKQDDGTWRAEVESEDWHFSRQAHRLGARLYATRKVAIHHIGSGDYTNEHVWGAMTVDPKHPEVLV